MGNVINVEKVANVINVENSWAGRHTPNLPKENRDRLSPGEV